MSIYFYTVVIVTLLWGFFLTFYWSIKNIHKRVHIISMEFDKFSQQTCPVPALLKKKKRTWRSQKPPFGSLPSHYLSMKNNTILTSNSLDLFCLYNIQLCLSMFLYFIELYKKFLNNFQGHVKCQESITIAISYLLLL